MKREELLHTAEVKMLRRVLGKRSADRLRKETMSHDTGSPHYEKAEGVLTPGVRTLDEMCDMLAREYNS